jgi:hypothetical protein
VGGGGWWLVVVVVVVGGEGGGAGRAGRDGVREGSVYWNRGTQ